MDKPKEILKRCRLCRQELPISSFYKSGTRKYASRCKECHGLGIRRCQFCNRRFIGKSGRKSCSEFCGQMLRCPTFYICKNCGQLFGPISHLKRKFCSKTCKDEAATTGRKTTRKTLKKARNAQSLLRYHVQAGNIIRPSICEECGATHRAIEGAHFNYDEPLRVRWLCVPCHRRWDKREPKNATYVVSLVGDDTTAECGREEAMR